MNFILFGPPGIGKSTIIGTLKTLGQRAIDLEDVYPSKVRFTLPNNVDGVFIGAADLNPKRTYHNARKVLLYLPQGAYERRRNERDQANVAKASQASHQIDAWLDGATYDEILDVSPTPTNVAKILISMMKGAAHESK